MLQEVASLGAQRAAALAEADRLGQELRTAAIKAAQLGAPRTRIKDLAKVSPATLYGWFEAAGIEVRAKRPAAKKGEA